MVEMMAGQMAVLMAEPKVESTVDLTAVYSVESTAEWKVAYLVGWTADKMVD